MAEYEIKDGVGIIPEGTKKIEEYAFEDCTSLTSIVIPDSVTEIRGFSGCTGLTSIVIPDSVTEIGFEAFWLHGPDEHRHPRLGDVYRKVGLRGLHWSNRHRHRQLGDGNRRKSLRWLHWPNRHRHPKLRDGNRF